MRIVKASVTAALPLLLIACNPAADETKRLGFASLDEMKDIHAKGWHTKQKYDEDQAATKKKNEDEAKKVEELKNAKPGESSAVAQQPQVATSFLKSVLGTRWSIGNLPCETNGGAYETFTEDRGVVFTAGGKPQIGEARLKFEYIDQGPEKFSYRQQYFANDTVTRLLGDSNVVTAQVETTYTKIGATSIAHEKKITQLNGDALLKGVKKYDVQIERGEQKLCGNPRSTPSAGLSMTSGSTDEGQLLPCKGEYNESTWTNCIGERVMQGNVKFKGQYQQGIPQGKGSYTFPDGTKYVGDVRRVPNGYGVMTYANGDRYEGQWKDGKQHGKGTATSAEGRTWTGEWNDGARVLVGAAKPPPTGGGVELVCKGQQPRTSRNPTFVDCGNRRDFIEKLEAAWRTLRKNSIGGQLEDLCWQALTQARDMNPAINFENISDSFLARCNMGLEHVK